MDFLKISLWLFTAVLSVYSDSRSHTGSPSCPYYPFHYLKQIHDQRNCFCFSIQNDYKKVPEVIHPDGLFSERLVYYVYKDLHSGHFKLYIPNREKQILIPDLAFEEGDLIIENPSDIIHSFNDLKVVIEINHHKHIINESIVVDDTVTTVTSNEPTITTETQSTITDEVTVTNVKPTATTEETTVTTKKSTFPTEEPTVSKHTVTTEKPTTVTNKPTVTIEEKTVTNEITTTTDEPTGTTEGPTTITDEPSVTNKKPTVTTEKPTSTTNEPTVAIEEDTVTNAIRTTTTDEPTGTTVSTVITEEPTTAHTPEITIITEETTVTYKIPSTGEPINTESPQPAVTTDVPSVTPEDTIFTTKDPTTKEQNTTKSPEPAITTAVPTTSEEPSPVTIAPLPNDDRNWGPVFSLQDLYKIIQVIQKKKDEPNVNLWEQILLELKLHKSQVNKDSEFDKGRKIEFDIIDDSDFVHNSYTFDLWFEQQLDGFSESDGFISLAEIKQYVRNVLLENGMIVTMEGLLTDLEGAVLDLRELKLRPILIGKPLNIGKIFEQKDHKSDFLIPSDSPYMQALVVTLSNPSMILGIIPLGKTTIQKTVKKSVTVPPPGKGMVKEWVQNGNKYGKAGRNTCGKNCENKRKENLWFNIKGRPKLSVEPNDPLLYSPSLQNKVRKHKYFQEYFKSPNEKYKVNSSRIVGFFKENDRRELDALKNQLFMDQKKVATEKDFLTAWQNDNNVQTGEEPALSINIDPNKHQAWENLLQDTIRSENVLPGLTDLLTAWKKKANTQTDGELISSSNVDDSIERDIFNNQLILDSKLIPANGLLNSWQHLGHLQAGNVKLDPIELDALNHKLVKGPILSEANEMLSTWQNSDKYHAGNGPVISFETDRPSELDALKNQLLTNPNVFGKAGIKLLAALQRKDFVKAGTGETIRYKVDDLKILDQLRNQLLKDPAIFAKTAKKLLSALQRKGIVQEGNGEAVKYKVHNPRELEALRNQLLKHPKIFARAAKELLTVMEHNGIVLSDIAPVVNETVATSLEDSVPSAEEYLYSKEYLSPEKGPWHSEDVVGYYDEVEDDITGRIVGGSAATGSGAPLSMKGRMKDFF